MRVQQCQNGAQYQVAIVGASIQFANGFLHTACTERTQNGIKCECTKDAAQICRMYTFKCQRTSVIEAKCLVA